MDVGSESQLGLQVSLGDLEISWENELASSGICVHKGPSRLPGNPKRVQSEALFGGEGNFESFMRSRRPSVCPPSACRPTGAWANADEAPRPHAERGGSRPAPRAVDRGDGFGDVAAAAAAAAAAVSPALAALVALA